MEAVPATFCPLGVINSIVNVAFQKE